MFDEDDENFLANTDGLVPDGLVDASQYAEIMSNILDNLKNLDPNNYMSTVSWVVNCVNQCYSNEEGVHSVNASKATDTVTALAYFILSMSSYVDEDRWDDFISHNQDNIIPELLETAPAMPFYDLDDKVSEMLEMFISDVESFKNAEE
jgi:hypothetical protein